jgi:hypothetical protein
MQSLDLNLATRPFRNNTLLWTGYGTAFVLLIGFGLWSVISWREHVTRLNELEDTVPGIERKMIELDQRDARARAGIESFDLEALEVQAAKANEVIEWKAFSWTRLFNLMEKVQPNDVRMTSVRPLFRAGRRRDQMGAGADPLHKTVPVSVEGLAKDFRSIWELQDALHADVHFGRVIPQRLQKTDRGEIVFQLTFIYHPDNETEDGDAGETLAAAVPAEEAPQEAAAPAVEVEDEVPLEEAEAKTIRPVAVEPTAVATENVETAEAAGAAAIEDGPNAPQTQPQLAGGNDKPIRRRPLPEGRRGKKTTRDTP